MIVFGGIHKILLHKFKKNKIRCKQFPEIGIDAVVKIMFNSRFLY